MSLSGLCLSAHARASGHQVLAPFHFSNSQSTSQANSQKAKRHHPYSLRRRVRRSPFSLSLKNMRGWRAKWRNHCSFVPRSLSRTRSASRRATQTSLRRPGLFAASSFLRRAALCGGRPVRPALSRPGLPSFPTASPAEPRAGLNAAVSQAPGRQPFSGRRAEPRRRPGACFARHARGRRILLHHQDASR